MAYSEAEWITVANNLLLKCRINLRIRELEDCDANVFIALYQCILGEKVPDLITIPKSQEDEAHNVQAVIDSLALDYLQVSLSHITGENIVKGDKESIKNLLEILDGLLEYLTEHVSEASHEKSETEQYFKQSEDLLEVEENIRDSKSRKKVSFGRCSMSPEALGPSWEGDEAESTGELIRLGDTAHTFSLRSNGVQDPNEMQSNTSTVPHFKFHKEALEPPSSTVLSKTRTSLVEDAEIPVDLIPSARKLGEPIRSAIPLHPPYQPSEEQRAPYPVGKDHLLSGHCFPATTSTREDTAFPVESENSVFLTFKLHNDNKQEISPDLAQSPRTRKLPKGKRYENKAADLYWDSSFSQRLRKRLTEHGLHSVSEKLSQRLYELDLMLKSALGDRVQEKTDSEEEIIRSEDTLSQHSDSIMERELKKPRPGLAMRRKPPYRSHSLSPSPVNKNKQFMERKSQKPKETDNRRFQAKVITEAFERELRRSKIQENIGPLGISDEEETKIYREPVLKGTPKSSRSWKMCSRRTTTQSPRDDLPKPFSKAVSMKINEQSLLPMMLEQFPFLYVSGQTLSKMWKKQIAQIEQLKKDACRKNQSKKKLQDEIEEALRRHELLTALVKKEYEHNKRLQDFKDRIHRQKYTQSKIKENRQQIIRARKYYDDYRVHLRSKMMKMRTREEMIFKKLFEEGLQIQKQRLRDLRNYAKEKRDEQKRQHQNELDSMENYYKDQFSLLAEAISQEHQELKAREKSQAQTLCKVKRELRAKMEKEIQQLQHMITENDDDAFFRELEAEHFRAQLHLASFQFSKNHFF
ncbi:centrosomal protein of 95 kDa isoform X3 [Sorex araneus]|uniref:centrosomal protein of 95 kDa isoform X3 n=1 Tax=Sorex araneus TaxID=42254 RepID=UPI00243341DC|nr:centrosomal protein of 95 kDa isoform X3 [Sorex araneus]